MIAAQLAKEIGLLDLAQENDALFFPGHRSV